METLENLFSKTKESIKEIGNYAFSTAKDYLTRPINPKEALKIGLIAILTPWLVSCAFSGKSISPEGMIKDTTRQKEITIPVGKTAGYIPDKSQPKINYILLEKDGKIITHCRSDYRETTRNLSTGELKITGWEYVLAETKRKKMDLEPGRYQKRKKNIEKIEMITSRGKKVYIPVDNIKGVGKRIPNLRTEKKTGTNQCYLEFMKLEGAELVRIQDIGKAKLIKISR